MPPPLHPGVKIDEKEQKQADDKQRYNHCANTDAMNDLIVHDID